MDAFFLQVQGSGRVRFEDGSMVRLGYGDQNGHPYRSIGRWLVDQGEMTLDDASMTGIKAWIARNNSRAKELLNQSAGFDQLDAHLDRELQELARVADGTEVAEGIAAFFGKRTPMFTR